MQKAEQKPPKRRHASTLRIRIDIADALDRVQWETGRAKSAVICEAVMEWLRLREIAIREGRPRLVTVPSVRAIQCQPKPESRIMDQLEVAEDPRKVGQ
jgi:hypothetical protein